MEIWLRILPRLNIYCKQAGAGLQAKIRELAATREPTATRQFSTTRCVGAQWRSSFEAALSDL